MADQAQSWGVTQVMIRYVAGADTWEVSLDPKKIDALVFNWQRFKAINAVVGEPLPRTNHLLPDGRRFDDDEPPAEVARRMGLKGPPRRVGPREAGTSEDPVCIHNAECTWWCIAEGHTHEDP